jgi:hypothetical protein
LDNRFVPPEPAADRTYQLVSRATGFSLCGIQFGNTPQAHTVFAMAGEGDEDFPGVDFDFATASKWTLERADVGFRLRHNGTGLMLDSNLERQVYLLESNDGSFQKWRLLDGDDENHWSLLNLATGFALDGNLERDIFTMRRNDGAFQRWRFDRLGGPPPEVTMQPTHESEPLEVGAPFNPATFGEAPHE